MSSTVTLTRVPTEAQDAVIRSLWREEPPLVAVVVWLTLSEATELFSDC